MLTAGPLRPNGRVGTGGDPAAVAGLAGSSARPPKVEAKATPTGAARAPRRKFRRVSVDF